MSANLVDTCDAVAKVVDDIVNAVRTPLLFIDLEGINLSRQGSVSVMQLLLPPTPAVHLLDVFRLQDQAFTTAGTTKKTLKDILESDQYVKVFFDVRNDSDALFSHYGVKLNGVIDLQLVEYASRPKGGRFIKGLAKCISEDCHLTPTERSRWTLVKEVGQKLFAPEKGGAYSVFNERPMPDALQDYCVQDVMVLPRLLRTYAARVPSHMAVQVLDEGRKRVAESQAPWFNGQGSHMALAPSFRWTRPASVPVLQPPFDILCSGDLSDYCAVQDVATVPPSDEETSCVPTEPARSSTPTSTSDPHPSTTTVVQQLLRLQIDEEEAADSGAR